jgi:hypothetical protein
MSNKQTGGPAFPGTQYANGIQPSGFSQGMTLRDYFAAKAMQAMLAHPNSSDTAGPESYAAAAYKMADAMLKAREA